MRKKLSKRERESRAKGHAALVAARRQARKIKRTRAGAVNPATGMGHRA